MICIGRTKPCKYLRKNSVPNKIILFFSEVYRSQKTWIHISQLLQHIALSLSKTDSPQIPHGKSRPGLKCASQLKESSSFR